jgi:hypothetical protein
MPLRKPLALLALAGLALILAGCASVKPEDYAGTTPRLVLEEYFLGKTRAHGIFQDRSGRLRRQFTVDIDGRMEGGEMVLTEDFVYADGERSQRIWRIRRLDEHRYEGRAADVVGTATGIAYGQALNWRYDLDLTVGEDVYRVHFDDWMFLQDDGVLLNRAEMRKFGFRLGEVTIVFQRADGVPRRE